MLDVTVRWVLLKLLSISCRVRVICCSSFSSSSVSDRLLADGGAIVLRDMVTRGLRSFSPRRHCLLQAVAVYLHVQHGRVEEGTRLRAGSPFFLRGNLDGRGAIQGIKSGIKMFMLGFMHRYCVRA
jgi:hypothetical protein